MRAWFAGLTAVLASASLLTSEAVAQPTGLQVAPDLIIETVDQISAEELWHLSIPQHVASKVGKPPGGVVGLWNYGRENRRTDGGWFAVCILLDGFGDIGEKPVAIRVWSRSPSDATVTERSPDQASAMIVEVAVNQSRFTISHTPMGTVFLNGDRIGQIQ